VDDIPGICYLPELQSRRTSTQELLTLPDGSWPGGSSLPDLPVRDEETVVWWSEGADAAVGSMTRGEAIQTGVLPRAGGAVRIMATAAAASRVTSPKYQTADVIDAPASARMHFDGYEGLGRLGLGLPRTTMGTAESCQLPNPP
jgi:hypothetical protein